MWGVIIKALIAAVLEWARQLIADKRAAETAQAQGRAEQAEADAKEIADANAEQAAKADEEGAIAGRPLDRASNRSRLRDGSA